jgi:predicted molibdopterin-dependent oxidoreductase YjgC
LLQVLGVPNIDVAVRTGPSDNLLIKPEKAANARGARDLGLQPAAAGVGLPGMLEAAASGRLTALYVCGADLWETADRELLTKALERVEYLIVQDVFRSPLTERAHLVLPAATFAEKVGTFTNHAGRVQRLERAIALQEGQLSDGEIFTRLLRQVSEGHWTFQPEEVLAEIAATVPAYAGLSLARIGPLGCGLAEAGAGAAG